VHIVSDDPVGTRRLKELFVSKGLNVACFTTAAEYIVAQRDDRPACLILPASRDRLEAGSSGASVLMGVTLISRSD
jgi:FixJ family two-component response regulator